MKVQLISKCVGLILGVSGLVGCQQADHSFSSDSSVEIASSIPVVDTGTPSSPNPPTAQLPLPKTSVDCGAFMNAPAEIDFTATKDRNLTGTSEPVEISEALRNITVVSGSGPINIRSAITAAVLADSGQIRLNAQTITSAVVASGSLCIRADQIGKVDAKNASGPQILIANTIDSLALGNAPIHIYNATVKALVGKSNGGQGSTGQICLHNGAKILNYDRYNLDVATSNCH